MSRADNALLEMAEKIPAEFDEIEEIRVFGSYAHGRSSVRSDLDILLLTERKIADAVRRGIIRERIDEIAGRQNLAADAVFYTYEVYQTDSSRFTRELKKSRMIYRRG